MIDIKKHAGIYQVYTEQVFTGDLEDVWDFFSMPQNLNELTPDEMNFEILTEDLVRMYEGQIICYKIEAIKGWRHTWVTEIKSVVPGVRFVDEQRMGPYAMWHHEHHFEQIASDTIQMNDIVTYKLPVGWIGDLVAGSFIRNKVRNIFEYREKRIFEIFGK